jgi:UDP-N-acetylmuramate-alanine ligase
MFISWNLRHSDGVARRPPSLARIQSNRIRPKRVSANVDTTRRSRHLYHEWVQARKFEFNPDLVIVGNVISKKYDEAQALLESKIPFTSLPQAMGALVIEDRHCIVVAGTHGKTTTTALNSFIADELNLKPGFMIGAFQKISARAIETPKETGS